MKRIFALFLCFVMLFLAVSCSSSIAQEETAGKKEETLTQETENIQENKKEDLGPITLPKGFSAGYSSRVANPAQGTVLGGWPTAADRKSKTIQDDIEITLTALCDGENIFLLFGFDTLYISASMFNRIAKVAQEEYAIPAENIIINATHTHCAPYVYASALAGIAKYLKMVYPMMEEMMEEAIRDLAPATVFAGQVNTEGMAWVRRYVTLDGKTYLGGLSMEKKEPTEARHENEADNQMQVVKFDRAEKKDIIMVNWQCHPCSYSAGASEYGSVVSSDWVGVFRRELAKNEQALCSYVQGSAGNLEGSTRIEGEEDNSEDYKQFGRALAAFASKALEGAEMIETSTFRAVKSELVCTYNEKYRDSEGVGETGTAPFSALTIGDLAFAVNSAEYHDTLGVYVKENSPFKITFISAYSNGCVSYVPSSLAFDNGGYEPSKCQYVKGTGEAFAEEMIRLLRQIAS